MRIISMEKGGDVKGVFSRLARGIKAVGDSVKAESGKDFALSEQYGYIHSCPTNLGTGMRASVMIDLPGYTKEGLDALKKRCEELAVQPRGTRGESGGYDGESSPLASMKLHKCINTIACTDIMRSLVHDNVDFRLHL